MGSKSLNDLIKKYEDIREQINSEMSWIKFGFTKTRDSLFIIDEFLKDLKEVK